MQNYAVYYDYKVNKSDLIILFKNKMEDRVDKLNNVDVYYSQEEIVKYVIHGINNVIKIYSNGLIHSPLKELVDVINIFLSKAKLEKLPYKENSGFVVGKVIDNNLIDLGRKIIHIECERNLLNKFVVVALPNTFININKFVSDYYLCTYLDLGIEENKDIFVIEDESEIGKDFYLWEEK